MPRSKGMDDELIIAALLDNGSVTKAAEALGINRQTIHARMQDDDFQEAYKAAKADLIRGAVYSINRRLSEAVEVVADIMRDSNANPATRLQACQTIINASTKLAERLATDEKPKESPFSFF